jgi:hypothetical protein
MTSVRWLAACVAGGLAIAAGACAGLDDLTGGTANDAGTPPAPEAGGDAFVAPDAGSDAPGDVTDGGPLEADARRRRSRDRP